MKQMGELLRKGARMLSETCPECNTPLFQLRDGRLICPMCNKPVVIVPADADVEVMTHQGSIEQTLLNKVKEIQSMLETESTDWPAIIIVTVVTIGVLVLSLW